MARSGRVELTPEKAKTRLAAWLSQRFFVRFHLSLILGFCLAAGLLTTKGFLALGMETMHWRWPLALLASYLAFLLGVRIWLAYVGIGRFLDRRGDSGSDVLDMVDGFGGSSSGGGSGSVGSGASSGGSGGFSGGGGRFGGGGASGNFSSAGDGESLSLSSVGSSGSSSPSGLGKFFGGGGGSSGSGGSGGDLDEGIFVVLAIAALLAVVFGAGIYLIWQAPALLAEAAFEGALAGGLVNSVRRIDDPGWIGGAVRASALPFIVIFACTMAIAGLAEHYAPEARTLPEAIHLLLQ